MEEYNIYSDIAQRSQGDVYIGVVGPVRTGKSTFIKKFMDLLVIPNIENVYQAERTRDELPQSAGGRTIMTTEPKFIPNEAVEISLGDNAHLKVRMIDCVGYIVDSSLGYVEDNEPRMVTTPWFDHPIAFNEAAEIGTKKVICEHSTIGLVVTTDGTITEIDRNDYVDAENRVINELKAINKPFIVLLNSVAPNSQSAQNLKAELEAKHGVPVVAVNCEELNAADIHNIIETVLFEFPLKEINIKIPDWIEELDSEHWLKKEIYGAIIEKIEDVNRIRDVRALSDGMGECGFVQRSYIEGMDLGDGTVKLCMELPQELFYRVLGEMSGFEIDGEHQLMTLMSELAQMKAPERLPEVLEEVVKVRADLGYPPLGTPFSQMCGAQATINVISGNRYQMIPKEVTAYVEGKYGKAPGPVSEELKERILGDDKKPITCRPADLIPAGYEKICEECKDIARTEEDILTYAIFPQVGREFLEKKYNG